MDDEIDLTDAILYADSNRGQYIPQFFAQSIVREFVEFVSEEDFKILSEGPTESNECYWHTWDSVMNNAEITLPAGQGKARLYQDGDLWIVPVKG